MDVSVDITDNITSFASVAWLWLLDLLPHLLTAAAVLVIGYFFARYASRGVAGLHDRSGRVDPTLKPIIRAVVRYAIWIVVLVAALAQLGVQTASVLAALGAAGLAIGLALQGTLANIAAGMMLLWLRPFRVGDYIETDGVAGTVEELSLFHSRIRTWDGIYKFVPNSGLWSKTITNYTRNPTRLVLIDIGIAYESDVSKARKILREFAENHPRVLQDPAVKVVPLSLADSAVVLQIRAWSRTPDFWDVRWDLTEGGKAALEEAGLTIPFPQTVVHFADPGILPPGLPMLPPHTETGGPNAPRDSGG